MVVAGFVIIDCVITEKKMKPRLRFAFNLWSDFISRRTVHCFHPTNGLKHFTATDRSSGLKYYFEKKFISNNKVGQL